MTETEILVEQQPPQGVFVCDHAGLVINEFSKKASEVAGVFRGFHDLPREAPKIRDYICETHLKVVSNMWFQIFGAPLGTCRTFRSEARNRGFGGQI